MDTVTLPPTKGVNRAVIEKIRKKMPIKPPMALVVRTGLALMSNMEPGDFYDAIATQYGTEQKQKKQPAKA